jgi:hypothetical protein
MLPSSISGTTIAKEPIFSALPMPLGALSISASPIGGLVDNEQIYADDKPWLKKK